MVHSSAPLYNSLTQHHIIVNDFTLHSYILALPQVVFNLCLELYALVSKVEQNARQILYRIQTKPTIRTVKALNLGMTTQMFVSTSTKTQTHSSFYGHFLGHFITSLKFFFLQCTLKWVECPKIRSYARPVWGWSLTIKYRLFLKGTLTFTDNFTAF